MSDRLIRNPVLPGFNPDPSILRHGDDYYIATSTFEWFPGVRIYHSKDLANWELVATPLNRLSKLDMSGEPDSCGVWAPCLTEHDGVFYLVYTDVKRFGGNYKDTHNYVVTATDIRGEWSDPVYLNSSGFDPSLFHDDDGRHWLLNMVWDHRATRGSMSGVVQRFFYGIVIQEYDIESCQLLGKPELIFKGSPIGLTEGPHLYKKDDYYYLLVAEGGTGKDHAAVFARSRQLKGPYESDPQGPVVTSAPSPLAELRRAGHASIVLTESGETYLAHLCGRPVRNRGRCVMGRETALQKLHWVDGWPRMTSGGNAPELEVESCHEVQETTESGGRLHHESFDKDTLSMEMQSLRVPLGPDQMSLTDRPGFLRLYGAESIGSLYRQSLVARRQQAFCFEATTCLEFSPENFQQMAGLVCYYNGIKYAYLHLTWHEEIGRALDLAYCGGSNFSSYPLGERPIALPDGPIWLKAKVDHDVLRFSYATQEDNWIDLPPVLDYSVLSDEVGDENPRANFTGAFVGLCCQDVSGCKHPADFSFFEYMELPSS